MKEYGNHLTKHKRDSWKYAQNINNYSGFKILKQLI